MFTLLAIASGGLGIYFDEKGRDDLASYATYSAGAFVLMIVLSMLRVRRFKRRG